MVACYFKKHGNFLETMRYILYNVFSLSIFEDDGIFGNLEPNGNFSGLVGDFARRNADLSFNNFDIMFGRSKVHLVILILKIICWFWKVQYVFQALHYHPIQMILPPKLFSLQPRRQAPGPQVFIHLFTAKVWWLVGASYAAGLIILASLSNNRHTVASKLQFQTLVKGFLQQGSPELRTMGSW